MKFKAAILEFTKKPLVIDYIENNDLEYGQVLVKINQTGVCRSQIFEMDGERGVDKWLPHLLGHEAVGRVVQIGEGVTTVREGDNVVLSWIKSKGISAKPAKFKWGNKVVNSGCITTFSEYTVCSEDRCISIEKKFTDNIGPALGCALPTGYGISLTFDGIKSVKNAAVIGLGGIGLSALLGIKNETEAKIFSIDLNDDRLLEEKELGSDYVLNPIKDNDIEDFIYKQTNGQLLDLVIECSGNINALEKSLGLINHSGMVKFATHPKFGDFLKIDPFELILGKRIEGSWGGGVYPDTHLPLIASKASQNTKFCNFYKSKFYNLEDINLAFDDLRTGKALRPVISFKEI